MRIGFIICSDARLGDELVMGAQKAYLKTLRNEAKEAFADLLTKRDASRRINAAVIEDWPGDRQAT